jgi:hypothetical protein
LNNFAIQNISDSVGTQSTSGRGEHVDQVFERHEAMIDNADKTTDKGPRPFTTMYYNDPQYIDKFSGSILEKNSRNSLNNQVNGRVGNNGLIATSENQQSANSLVQNVTQNPLGPEQVSRPATKDDFVMHTVRPSDTLERICIQYNVNKDAIRMAN